MPLLTDAQEIAQRALDLHQQIARSTVEDINHMLGPVYNASRLLCKALIAEAYSLDPEDVERVWDQYVRTADSLNYCFKYLVKRGLLNIAHLAAVPDAPAAGTCGYVHGHGECPVGLSDDDCRGPVQEAGEHRVTMMHP